MQPIQPIDIDIDIVRAAIRDLIADVAGVPANDLEPATNLDAIGIDSLLIVEVVIGIERRFGVGVPPSAFRGDIHTVSEVCDALGAFVCGELHPVSQSV
jgi:acyl carrier protein